MFTRTSGIEIEAIAPVGLTREALARAISSVGVVCEAQSYNHTVQRDKWKIVTDGSLTTGFGPDRDRGMEIVGPPMLGAAGDNEIERVCSVLSEVGMTINRSCGLHVHVDVVRPHRLDIEALKRLALLYAESEGIIDTMLPPSRRADGNPYAHTLTNLNVRKLMNAGDVSTLAKVIRSGDTARYVKLNFLAYWKYGTVEFRHHSGTIDAGKILKWQIACQRMVEVAAHPPSTTAAMVEEVEHTVRTVRAAKAGSKNEVVFNMLTREQGCTTYEVLQATGWKQVSIAGMGHGMGLDIRKQRVREEQQVETFQYPRSETGAMTMGEIIAAVPVTRTRMKKVSRYFGVPTTGPIVVRRRNLPVSTKPQNVDDFCTRLNMTDDEKAFWHQRAALFAQPSVSIAAERI